jgi:hypothetical protein
MQQNKIIGIIAVVVGIIVIIYGLMTMGFI